MARTNSNWSWTNLAPAVTCSRFKHPDEGGQSLSAADAHGDDAVFQVATLQILSSA